MSIFVDMSLIKKKVLNYFIVKIISNKYLLFIKNQTKYICTYTYLGF